MLSRVTPPQGFATLYYEGQMAAVGLGVVTGDALWFFDIVTDAAWRNRGLGKQLMLHLIQWGKANGATTAYLQVMADNAPAVRLYEKLGFKEMYQYWYRVKRDV
jgi:ribosomal protein S18 acetylase RimI-like enzyme